MAPPPRRARGGLRAGAAHGPQPLRRGPDPAPSEPPLRGGHPGPRTTRRGPRTLGPLHPLPPGRPAAGPGELRLPLRDLRSQHLGNGVGAGGRAAERPSLRRGRDHQRQVLRGPRRDEGPPGDRSHGRPRSLQREQGRGRDRGGGLPALLLPGRRGGHPPRQGGHGARGERDRRRRLGRGSNRARYGPGAVEGRTRRGQEPRIEAPLAARLGAPRRIPDARLEDGGGGRARTLLRLELRAVAGRRARRLSNRRALSRGVGRGKLGGPVRALGTPRTRRAQTGDR
jgi:hypothetical protein